MKNYISFKTWSFKQANYHGLFACLLVLTNGVVANGQNFDWMTAPSTYTHSPVDGQRVDQFAEPIPALAANRPDFVRSGYRNFRSSLQAGGLADNYNVVEQWGNPVQPFGEWRFPFRPFSVPYPAWGPQPVPFGGVAPFPGGVNPYGNPFGPFFGGGSNGFGGPGPGFFPGGGQGGYPGWGQGGSGGPINPGGNPNMPNANPYLPGAPSPTEPPWYDGTYPEYPLAPLPSDRDFYRSPSAGMPNTP